MDNNTLYISLDQSVLVFNKNVSIKDIAHLFCINKDVYFETEKIKLFSFDCDETTPRVITIMKIIEEISKRFKDTTIISLGAKETIIYYEPIRKKNSGNLLKFTFLALIAFLGTAYSIMSYNCDVGSRDLLDNIYKLFVSNSNLDKPAFNLISTIVYSFGLCVGLIVFFNHGNKKKKNCEPTPLQVQMRVYENEVNSCIITNYERHKDIIDVD